MNVDICAEQTTEYENINFHKFYRVFIIPPANKSLQPTKKEWNKNYKNYGKRIFILSLK